MGAKSGVALLLTIAFCIAKSAKAERPTAYNTTLSSPQVTNWGDWGEWDLCPNGEFVFGMQLKTLYYVGAFSDDSALNAIKFYCDTIGSDDSREYITSKIGEDGSFHNEFFCSNPVRGFQMLSENNLGWFNDDTAASNLRLFCGGRTIEGDGEKWGSWTTPQYCDPKQAICGLRTQVEAPNSDSSGLNNIQALCCPVPDPAESCVPSDDWDLILECDNINSTSMTKCTYERKVGATTWNMMSESSAYMSEIYSGIGFSLGDALGALGSNFQAHLGMSQSTSYNWTSSTGEVWTEETTITVELEVPPGVRTQLLQPKGVCSFYSVRANKLKRMDFSTKSVAPTVSFIDF